MAEQMRALTGNELKLQAQEKRDGVVTYILYIHVSIISFVSNTKYPLHDIHVHVHAHCRLGNPTYACSY